MTALTQDVAVWAYLAGLIDGEGTIGIKRRMPTDRNCMVSPKYSIHVGVSMTDREPVDLLARYCDAAGKVTSRVRRDGYKTIFEFAVENDRAAQLLKSVRTYLVGKAKQADIALAFHQFKKSSPQHMTKVVGTSSIAGPRGTHPRRVMALSDDYIAGCDRYYESLLKINPRSGQPGAWGRR